MKKQLKAGTLPLIFITLGVVSAYALYIFVVIPYTSKQEKKRQAELDNQCYAQIVNETEHEVAVFMYGHDDSLAQVLKYEIPPMHLLKIREDMSKEEYYAFPPKEMMDSVLLVFDDTLEYWQVPSRDKGAIKEKHSLYDRYYWSWCKIVVQARTLIHPELYRSGMEFKLTESDYNRALSLKKENETGRESNRKIVKND